MARAKVLIDATELTNQFRFRGVGNLAYSLIRQLIQNKDIDWQIMAPGNKQGLINALGYDSAAELPNNFEFYSLGKGIDSVIYKLFMPAYFYLRVLPVLKRVQPDLCIFINVERGVPLNIPTLAFVHDVIPLKTGKYSQKSFVANFIKKNNYLWAINRAKKVFKVLTISEFTKKDIVSVGFPEERIEIIPLAISEMFSGMVKKLGKDLQSDQNLKRRTLNIYNITSPYVLYSGGLEANKNVGQLLKAFAEVSDKYPDLKLVIGGDEFKLGWDHKAAPQNERAEAILQLAKDLKIKHRVTFTGFIDAQHLPIILRYASCFVHLSKYEGFGLSVLEPQLVGTPVIAANRSSFPEVLQDSAILVDPEDTAEIANQLSRLLQSDKAALELREELTTKGKKNISRYSWAKSANKLETVINNSVSALKKSRAITEAAALTKQNANSQLNSSVDKTTTKKAVVIAAFFYPYVGGMEQVALDYARFLVQLGFDVTVLTADRKQGQVVIRKEEDLEGIHIKRLKRRGKNYYFYILKDLFTELKAIRPDLIHMHSFGFLAHDWAVWRYKRFVNNNVKVINTPHGSFMSKPETGIRQVVKVVVNLVQSLYLPKLLDHVIAVNPTQFQWLERMYRIKEANITMLTPIMPQSPPNIKSILKAKQSKPYVQITSLSRLTDYKGFDDIVAAFNEVNTATMTKLTIAGKSDNYEKEINQLIGASPRREDIKLEKNISNAERDKLLSETDIFILASEWEAFGIVIAEAMAWGAAIISTTTEGGRFLVEPGVNGLLFDYKDMRKLIENINKLLNDQPLLYKMQKNSSAMVAKYSESVMREQYYTLLKRLGLPIDFS